MPWAGLVRPLGAEDIWRARHKSRTTCFDCKNSSFHDTRPEPSRDRIVVNFRLDILTAAVVGPCQFSLSLIEVRS